MQDQAIAQQLKNLKDEASALWFTNYKLAEQIGEVIEAIGAPADGPAQRARWLERKAERARQRDAARAKSRAAERTE